MFDGQTGGELGGRLKTGIAPRHFDTFFSLLAVNTAVELHSRVLTSKTYGEILG